MSQDVLNQAAVSPPDISHITIEDDTPVDNFQSEKQQRLLVEPLYSSGAIARPFVAAANVGLFYAVRQPPIVPDVFLSLGVEMPTDWSQRQNRTYFFWEFGKPPDVAIEVVSNREGNELGRKKETYARIGVPYYAVFDPLDQLQEAAQMNGVRLRTFGLHQGTYEELPRAWFSSVGLGLVLWEGSFEDQPGQWLRWCDEENAILPTGAELAIQEQQRANSEQQRADRLAEHLRSLGIDPDTI